jgi:hypothetical protein
MNVSDESKSLGSSELIKHDILKARGEVLHKSITVSVEIHLINLIKMFS